MTAVTAVTPDRQTGPSLNLTRFRLQALHVSVNEEKALPVVIETRNVPVGGQALADLCVSVCILTRTEGVSRVLTYRAPALLQVLLYAQKESVEPDAIKQLIHLAESPLPVGSKQRNAAKGTLLP